MAAAFFFAQRTQSQDQIQADNVEKTADNVVFVRVQQGGLCPGADGSGKMCRDEATLYSNGDFGTKSLTAEQVAEARSRIAAADFSSYIEKSSDEASCPSDTDGSDIAYRFPAKQGDKLFTVCKLNIPANDRLFTYLQTL
ncbi:MAG TPA: hypothetical protein VF572_03285 [Candidatus Saccharimonadales bacterium]